MEVAVDPDRIGELLERIERLEHRVTRLERGDPPLPSLVETPPSSTPPTGVEPLPATAAAEAALPLLGRTLLIMGGAFLLRASSDAGTLSPPVGITLGLLLSLTCLWFAGRAAAAGRPKSSDFFALSAALVGFPLLFDATLRLEILDRRLAAALLPALWLAGTLTAARSHSQTIAWIFSLGGGVTGLILSVGSGFWAPFVFVVLIMTLGGLWFGYLEGWHGLAIVGSAVADVLILVMPVLLLLRPQGIALDSLLPGPVLALQLSLVTLYLGSFLARALIWKEHISVPEILQALTAFAIGIGGGALLLRVDPSLGRILGPYAAVVAIVSYGVAFAFVDRMSERRRNFAFFSSAGLVAALVGAALLLDGAALTTALLIVALVAALAGAHYRRATLSLHGALFVLAASFSSGLLGFAADAMIGGPAAPPTAGQWLHRMAVVVAALLGGWVSVASSGRTWGRWSRASKGIDLLVIGIGLTATAIHVGGRLILDAPSADAGMLAALRTSLVALTAITMAALARLQRLRDARHLVGPWLLVGALLLVFGDLRHGRPLTHVVSMVVYGGALILAPRLSRGPQPDAKEVTDREQNP